MKRVLPAVAAAVLIAGLAWGGSIKTWAVGEMLKYTDLNNNFAHIHNLMVGGHGARLVNGDVSATAAIAHTKLATPALIPKAWLAGMPLCDGAAAAGTACSLGAQGIYQGIAAVTSSGTAGVYNVYFSTLPVDNKFATLVTRGGASNTITCVATSHAVGTLYPDLTTPQAIVTCLSTVPAAANAVFEMLVMDNT